MGKQMSLAQWSAHLETAGRQGETVASYARRHGLSLSGMYSARHALKKRGKALVVKASAPAAPRGFVPVVVPLRGRLTARLPNGVEVTLDGGDEAAMQGVLSTLGMLRCGA